MVETETMCTLRISFPDSTMGIRMKNEIGVVFKPYKNSISGIAGGVYEWQKMMDAFDSTGKSPCRIFDKIEKIVIANETASVTTYRVGNLMPRVTFKASRVKIADQKVIQNEGVFWIPKERCKTKTEGGEDKYDERQLISHVPDVVQVNPSAVPVVLTYPLKFRNLESCRFCHGVGHSETGEKCEKGCNIYGLCRFCTQPIEGSVGKHFMECPTIQMVVKAGKYEFPKPPARIMQDAISNDDKVQGSLLTNAINSNFQSLKRARDDVRGSGARKKSAKGAQRGKGAVPRTPSSQGRRRKSHGRGSNMPSTNLTSQFDAMATGTEATSADTEGGSGAVDLG